MKGLAARLLLREDAADVDAGRSREEAAGLDDEARPAAKRGVLVDRGEELRRRACAPPRGRARSRAGSRGCRARRRGPRSATGPPCEVGGAPGDLDRVAPLADEYVRVEDLRARRTCARRRIAAAPCTPTAAMTSARRSSSNPNCAGWPPMRMAPPLASAPGLKRTETFASRLQVRERRQLLVRLQVDLADPLGDDQLQLARRLAGPGEDDALRRAPRRPRTQELGARRDLEAGARGDEDGDHGGVGVRLDRVVDLDLVRQRGPQGPEAGAEDGRVVEEERRLELLREGRDGHAAHGELAVDDVEVLAQQRGGVAHGLATRSTRAALSPL